MINIVIQYVFVVLLIIGLAYFIYLISDKDNDIKENYYGINYDILGELYKNEITKDNIKKILRCIAEEVNFVEENYINEENYIKEEKALELSRDALYDLELNSYIEDQSIKYIIRLCTALMVKKI